MIIPFITLLKIVALGSIKLVFLLLGIAFFPVYALRLILGGATGMLLPALSWLVANGRLAEEKHKAIVSDLEELTKIDVTRSEARHLLWALIRKMITNFKESIGSGVNWVRLSFGKLFG